MRKSTQCTNQKRQGRGGKAVSALESPAADFLTIPTLHKSIPGTLELDTSGTRWAEIALLWLDAGVLTDQDEGSASELVAAAIHRWVTQQIEGNRYVRFFNPYVSTVLNEYGEYAAGQDVEDRNAWMFGIYGDPNQDWLQLEPKLSVLEKEFPGLARTVMAAIVRLSGRTLPVWEPCYARFEAEKLWWYGMSDDDEMRAEMEAVGDDPEEYEGIWPSEWDEQFPAWLRKGPELKPSAIRKIAKDGSSTDAQKVASLLLQIAEMENVPVSMPSPEPLDHGDGYSCPPENVYFLSCLIWKDGDPLTQLIDDRTEEANQMGDGWTELLGVSFVSLDPVQFQQWKSETENGFRLLRIFDELLQIIGTPVV